MLNYPTMSPKHPLSDEDKAAFRDAVNGVSSWEDDKKEAESQDIPSSIDRCPWISLDYVSDAQWVDGDSIISFARPGVSAKQVRRLTNGQLKFEQKTDFHGLSTEELHIKLNQSIHAARQSRLRNLLIIHGKGKQDGGTRAATLKNYLNQSLRQSTDVLAFHSAKPIHGGTGAIYVLLADRS
jgi:DNA-nicking Smr family endonuclease